jgi:hypothetical protein
MYETGKDLLAFVLRRAGEILPTADRDSPLIGQADYLIAAREYIDDAHREVVGLRAWTWGRSVRQLAVPPAQPVQATLSGTTVTLTPAPTLSTPYFLALDGEPTLWRVVSPGQLEVPYTGTSPGGPAWVFPAGLALPEDYVGFPYYYDSDGRRWVPIRPYADYGAEGALRFQLGSGLHEVRVVGQRQLLVLPVSEAPRTLVVAYARRPAPLSFDGDPVTDTPMLPLDSRILLGTRALERLFLDKRDARAQGAQAESRDHFARLMSLEVAQTRPRLYVPKGHRIAG